jgi:hypothetical protein
MSSILLCIFFLFLKEEKKRKEGINTLLNKTIEWKDFFFGYDHKDNYELRNSGKFNYWNNKQFGTQLRNNECWCFFDRF